MFNTGDLPKNFFEAVTKKPSKLPKKTQILKKICEFLLITLLTLVDYWSNQMEKLIAAVKIFLLK